ncbi:MAG: hypothetical protein WD572_10730 [Gammaproteobacteria bacterium]
MPSVKEAARSIVDNLPEHATWDDLMYDLYVKQKIEAGLEAADEGRSVPHKEVKARLLARKSSNCDNMLASERRTTGSP